MTRSLAILGLTFTVLGCTATQSAGTTPGLPPSPSSAQSAPTVAGYRNLQVLPRDISREQLLATMRTFTQGLGVRCNFCHVVTATTPEEKLDFPSDAKEEKRVARVMIQMTNQINAEWLERVEQAEGEEHKKEETASAHSTPAGSVVGTNEQLRVGCWTCHRGHDEPELPPSPPRPAS